MSNFLSDNIAKTSRERRDIKNQFGNTGDPDEFSVFKIENTVVRVANLVVSVDGVETVRRRWQWRDTSDFKKGTISQNMRWDKGKLQVG